MFPHFSVNAAFQVCRLIADFLKPIWSVCTRWKQKRPTLNQMKGESYISKASLPYLHHMSRSRRNTFITALAWECNRSSWAVGANLPCGCSFLTRDYQADVPEYMPWSLESMITCHCQSSLEPLMTRGLWRNF